MYKGAVGAINTEINQSVDFQERAVLVCVDTGEFDADVSLDELASLASTAGAIVVCSVVQRKERPEAATFVGIGKLNEIKFLCQTNDIDLLIFDGELSPSQQRNVESLVGVHTIDRTALILDIFALRARSSEGRLQVELAQLKYTLPRLGGQGTKLSRLGGGIGTRGPGETKLESDRRHIMRRIQHLEQELLQIEKRRTMLRERRKKDGVQTVAIVGYTNAGKSTLLNTLTDAGVLAEDKLFATLDPTARALTLPDGQRVVLIDTVGLIRRLPHKLVEAFKSTLEVAVDASVILNVCDCSDELCSQHLEVTRELLEELGCTDKPIISVMNKCDKIGSDFSLPTFGKTVMISALEKRGLDALLEAVVKELPPTRVDVEMLLPFSAGSFAAEIRRDGVVHEEEYRENGLYVRATVDVNFAQQHKEWLV